MKLFEFKLSNNLLKIFFPEKRIKSKVEIIEILMEATRYMLVNPNISEANVEGKILLCVDKMSRLFVFKQNKYYSIVFPFFAYEEDGNYKFSFHNYIDIDSALISKVISTIRCDEFKEKCSLDFISPIYDYENDYNDNFWIFLKEIILMEDGYIRYDIDEINFKSAQEKGLGNKHPLRHYDLFYTSNATFKIGLSNSVSESEFIDLLNVNTDCKYLTI